MSKTTTIHILDPLHDIKVVTQPNFVQLLFTQHGYGEDGVCFPAQEIWLHNPEALRTLRDLLNEHVK